VSGSTRARAFYAASLLATLVGVAGCGGGEEPGPAAATVTTTRSEPATDSGTATESSIPTAGEAVFFAVPSRNIGCAATEVSLRCDILDHEWKAPPPAEPCSLDYGGGIAVGEVGDAAFTCAGDTVIDPAAPVLAYGEYLEVGAYRCESHPAAIRCENTASGHGFELSRETVNAY
jgi:hypothetical protein